MHNRSLCNTGPALSFRPNGALFCPVVVVTFTSTVKGERMPMSSFIRFDERVTFSAEATGPGFLIVADHARINNSSNGLCGVLLSPYDQMFN